jgi:hypothetical protein
MLASLALAGCLNGPMYWTRVNATPQQFLADHHPCFDSALIGHGVGSEKAYKACMVQKGWIRTQGGGAEPPDVPYFRGPEDDEEFTPGARQANTLADPCQRSIGLDRDGPAPVCLAR